MWNTVFLPRPIVLRRSITYPQMVRNLEPTKEKIMKKNGLKEDRNERGKKKDQKTSKTVQFLIFIFKVQGKYLQNSVQQFFFPPPGL